MVIKKSDLIYKVAQPIPEETKHQKATLEDVAKGIGLSYLQLLRYCEAKTGRRILDIRQLSKGELTWIAKEMRRMSWEETRRFRNG